MKGLTALRLGLRTEILVSLALLLVAAMILTSFVVMRVIERDLLRYKAAEGTAVVEGIQAAIEAITKGDSPPPVQQVKERVWHVTTWLAPSALFSEIAVLGKDGAFWTGGSTTGQRLKEVQRDMDAVFESGKKMTQINRDRNLLTITAPLFAGTETIAAIRIPIRMEGVVKALRRSQQLIWLYIGLNVLVLLVFGHFLLSRVVIRPIKHLVETADQFKDSEIFSPTTDTDRNEIARLTMSLNRMLRRLAQNKEGMEAQIRSLEQANRALQEARQEVLRSEKLSSIGRLAAGVAHEVGNPIGTILGYANLLTAHVEDDEEAKDYLTRIEKEVSRIDAIVRELLDFSRPSPGKPGPLDVNTIVSESTAFFSRKRPMASIELETSLDQNVGVVWADQDQLKQVLINLMLNACDAMPDGGRLRMTTRRTLVPKLRGRIDEPPGEGVEISVSDTGTGIPAHEQDKLFDPFYTRKSPGKGTGLGLAISLRIVESFGGTIGVHSTEGQGSTFTITLNCWDPRDDTE